MGGGGEGGGELAQYGGHLVFCSSPALELERQTFSQEIAYNLDFSRKTEFFYFREILATTKINFL